MIEKRLYLFTATYPYGDAEVFLEDEIVYLSKAFQDVIVVPLSGRSEEQRKTPKNCIILRPILNSRWKRYSIGLFGWRSITVFFRDFWNNQVYNNRNKLKTWLIAFTQTNMILRSKTIKRIFKSIRPNDVCYFYWGKGCNVLAYFYYGKAKFVSRFHGEWDLWEESSGNYAPIRKPITDCLTKAVFISSLGEKYFSEKYPKCPTVFIPLGSPNHGKGEKSKDGIVRVVSCSSVYTLKRVPLILEALQRLKDKRVIWTHLGGGVDFEQLRQLVQKVQRETLTIVLTGQLTHDEVLHYYKTHPVDVFVNVSTNEGVPVSIMEALSFNIPVVATNVGGNSEIVTSESGILIDANPTPDQIAEAIRECLDCSLKAREFWQEHYSAETNYQKMAAYLINC